MATAVTCLSATALMADPPFPEDVLRPESSEGYWFIQPYAGLNYSFLLSPSVRDTSSALEEVSNDAIGRGAGLGLELGIDLGYRFSELISTRVGLFYSKKLLGAKDSATALCRITDSDGNVISTSVEGVDMRHQIYADYIGLGTQVDFNIDQFLIYLGYSAAVPFQLAYEETSTIIDTGNACFYLVDGPDKSKTVSGTLNEPAGFDDMRHAIKIGGGHRWEYGENSELVLQVQYEHPLNPALEGPRSITLVNEEFEGSRGYDVPLSEEISFGTLSATIGLRFNLGGQ